MLTLQEAKLQLNIPTANTTHDVELETYVQAAILVAEYHGGLLGELRTIAGERHVTCHWSQLRLFNKPVQSATSVARVDGSLTWDVANLDVDIDSGLLRVVSGPLFSGLLSVAYEAGHPAGQVPQRLNLAARIILQHLWQTQRGAMTQQGVRSVLDETVDNWTSQGRGYAIPNAALELLGEPIPVVA